MATHVPTQLGDVLILHTASSSSIYAVRPVSTAGQQGFSGGMRVQHVSSEAAAAAKALVGRGGRIFLCDIDTAEWREISNNNQ